jgi:hypothetical protein
LVLNQKEEKMKFNKCVIIKSKTVNRDYILLSGRDMEDIIKNKITTSSGDNRFTNMGDVHTCPIRSMNLFMAGVVIMHSELVKIPGNMIGGAGVSVPIIIVTGGNSSGRMRFRNIVLFKMMPTLVGRVPNFKAHLVLWSRRAAKATTPGPTVGEAAAT